MKKLLVLLILLTLFLSGCGIYNISSFTLPNDIEFINLVRELDTPEKICKYMEDNFEYGDNSILLTPYQLFLIKKGNCDDFSLFATSIANYYGYETYQILMELPLGYHMIGIFKEGNYYNISDNTLYIECFCKTFKEIMNFYLYKGWLSYTVYNHDMNIINIVMR